VFQRYRDIQQRSKLEEVSESGFTLIELLIVIIVLGILAAIVIFSISGVTGQSKAAACNTEASTIEDAVAAFNAAGNTPATPPLAFSDLTSSSTTDGPFINTPPPTTITNGYLITLDGTNSGQVDVTTGTTVGTNVDIPYNNGGKALCDGLS
jgi:prepilin-type N-terminal cleavage/methylation domain-containing protein